MKRVILIAIAAISILTASYIWFLPNTFYENTPGLSLMGPFSIHFMRDVALAFLACGFILAWGAWRLNREVAVAGATWLAFHSLFHVQIWGMRGFPFDSIFAFDLVAVIAPGLLAFWAAWGLTPSAKGVSHA